MSNANAILVARVSDRMDAISRAVRKIDHNAHSALLVSIVGALKCEARFNPAEMDQVLGSIETIVQDFLNNQAANAA